MKERTQLDDKGVFEPLHFNELTKAQRKQGLRLVQLIKKKRSGKIKGRTCADGRPQRRYITQEESTSPTVSIEALMLSLMIDAHENRVVATCDISGAFLHCDMDEFAYVVVDGELVNMLIRSNPKYAEYIHITRDGRKVVYLQLKKALYGTLKAARLFFENLTTTLTSMGFEANPYDKCVMIRIIDGKQCTIAFHVDDLKISHINEEVVRAIISQLEDGYGEMNVNIGQSHTYVGMDLTFPGDGTVVIDMKSYLTEALSEFGLENLDKRAPSTPAADHIFQVDDECKKLEEHRRELLRKTVAKLPFVSTRGRPDIHLAVSFLTSRVSKADEDDWKKLRRLLDFAGNWNKCTAEDDPSTAKSRSGYLITLGNNPVLKQIALSTTEAEYMPLSHALRETTPIMDECVNSFR